MSAKRHRLTYLAVALLFLIAAAYACQPPPDVEYAPTAVLPNGSTITLNAEIALTGDSLSTEGNSPTAFSTPELILSPMDETPPFSETPTLTATATITPTVTGTATVLQWPSPTRLVTLMP